MAEPHFPDLDVDLPDPRDLFDDHGLLIGDVGRTVWEALCLRVEADLDDAGWDQPARLLAVSNPVHTEAGAAPGTVEALRTAVQAAARDGAPHGGNVLLDGIPFAVHHLGDIEGHPVEQLWGEEAPDWVDALVLGFEGWVVPPLLDEHGNLLCDPDGTVAPDPYAHLPNSQHPRRVEIRQVMMVTRGGAQYAVARTRGQDPEPIRADDDGMLVQTLRRVLGLPTGPAPTTVGDLLGRIALAGALRTAEQLATGRPLPGMPAGMLAGSDQLQASLAAMPQAERTGLLTAAFARTLLAAMGHVAWKATDRPDAEDGAEDTAEDATLRGLVHDVARHGAGDREHLEALVGLARAAADLSFVQLAAAARAREFLPPEVADAPPGWADEGILARRLCWSEWPSQSDLRARVAELVGEVPEIVDHLLGAAGWVSDAPDRPDPDRD